MEATEGWRDTARNTKTVAGPRRKESFWRESSSGVVFYPWEVDNKGYLLVRCMTHTCTTQQTRTYGTNTEKHKGEEKMKNQTAVKVTDGHAGKKKHAKSLVITGNKIQHVAIFSVEDARVCKRARGDV